MIAALLAAGWHAGRDYVSTPWVEERNGLPDRVFPDLIESLCPCCTTWVWQVQLRFDGIRRNGAFGPVIGTSHYFRIIKERT